MSNIAKTIVALAIVCSVASPLQAAEGILIVEKTVVGSSTRSSQVQIERERMRAEMTSPSGDVQVVVFDGPEQVLRIISVPRKSYSEMTKADADRMGAQLAAAMAAMKDKIATMPPEQRAKMEALMSQLGTAGPWVARVEGRNIAAQGATRSVNGHVTRTRDSGTARKCQRSARSSRRPSA